MCDKFILLLGLFISSVIAFDCVFEYSQATDCALTGCNWFPSENSSIWKNCSEQGPSTEDNAVLNHSGGYNFEVTASDESGQGHLSLGSMHLGTGRFGGGIQVRFIGMSVTLHQISSVGRGGSLIVDLGNENTLGGTSLSIVREGLVNWMSGNIAMGLLRVVRFAWLVSSTGADRSLNSTIEITGAFGIYSTGTFHLLPSGVISNSALGTLLIVSPSMFQGEGSIINSGQFQVDTESKTDVVVMEVNVEGAGTILLKTGTLQASAMVQCNMLRVHQDSELLILPQGKVDAFKVNNQGSISIRGGSLEGSGNLLQNGTLTVDNNGHMDITGSVAFHPGSITEVRVFNSQAPPIRVHGLVTLGGTLSITIDKNVATENESSIPVIVGDELEGSFEDLHFSEEGGMNISVCAVETTTTSVVIHCAPGITSTLTPTDGTPTGTDTMITSSDTTLTHGGSDGTSIHGGINSDILSSHRSNTGLVLGTLIPILFILFIAAIAAVVYFHFYKKNEKARKFSRMEQELDERAAVKV